MSRAFVNEDNQEEAPIIPPRAPLPEGVPNYVTSYGLTMLKHEREQLLSDIEQIHGTMEDGKEKRYQMQLQKGKLSLLEERINSARLLEVKSDETNEVRFGAQVEIEFVGERRNQSFQIVGVDEADVKEKKIAFTAPIAKVITGKKTGEKALLQLGKDTRSLLIKSIRYDL